MIGGKLINDRLKETFAKEPRQKGVLRSVSRPVIRYENGKFRLAVFASFYTKEDLEKGFIKRPEVYGLADIEDGRLLTTKSCRKKDFSDAPLDELCALDKNMRKPLDDYTEKMFEYLDEARQAIQETGNPEVYMPPYKKYMEMALEYVQESYKRFYKDLSRPLKPEQPPEEEHFYDTDEPKNGRERKRQKDRSAVTQQDIDKKNKEAVNRVLGEKAGAEYIKAKEADSEKAKADSEKAKEQSQVKIQLTNDMTANRVPEKKEEPVSVNTVAAEEALDETVLIPPERLEEIVKEAEERRRNEEREKEKIREKQKEQAPVIDAEAINDEPAKQDGILIQQFVEEEKKTEYLYTDIEWATPEDISVLPDRYYNILLRIADKIEFLPCDTKQLRYKYPLFCFKKDSPVGDPWQMMQATLLNKEVQKGKYRANPGRSIFTSCKHKEFCIFTTCPYILAAYIRYMQLTDPAELNAQRAVYAQNKESIDAEGTSYRVRRIKRLYDSNSIREAEQFIDEGYFNISQKNGYIVSYVSNPKEFVPAFGHHSEIKAVTTFTLTGHDIVNFLSGKSPLYRQNGDVVPQGADLLVYTDYLIRNGELNQLYKKTEPQNDLTTIEF